MNKFISIGVAGHVDHGKTTLVRCLTGIDTDRLKEEKRRGLSIEPSVAPLKLPSGDHVALIDVPGHSDFLKNTIRGLSAVDIAILVVAADDGVMPQTKDHMAILNFLKAKGGLVVLSKADTVDSETLDIAGMEIQEALYGSFLEGKQVIPFSAIDGRGRDQILLAIGKEANDVCGKSVHAPFRLWIDQVRSFPGFGTVVSGTVFSGSIRQDDAVELLPLGKEAKVRFIEIHHQRVEQAVAGQRAGLNLQGISLQEIHLGMALATPGVLRSTSLLNSELSLLPTASRPILNRQRVKLFIGTYSTTALLVVMQKGQICPGETGLVQLRLQETLAAHPKDAFVISPMNQHCVIGGGKIIEASREKFRAANAEITLNYLQPLQKEDVKSFLSLYFSKFPSRPVTEEEIASTSGFPLERIRKVIAQMLKAGELLSLDGRGHYNKARYNLLKNKVIGFAKEILLKDTLKLTVVSDEIRFRLDPNLADALLERMLGELSSEGKLIKTEAGFRIPNFAAKHHSQREQLVEKVSKFAQERGHLSFHAGSFWELHRQIFDHKEVVKVLDHLHAQKKLVRLNDGRFLAVEAMQEIREKVRVLILEKGSATIKDCQDILGFGRDKTVPILDYLDSIGVTCRVGDARILTSGGIFKSRQRYT
jgi:selenocysteine-specific elongation factor